MAERPVHVLVVEDDAATREALVDLMSGWGWTASAAEGFAVGLKAIERTSPDLVVTDLVMPDGNGIELVRRLRGEGDTPIVILSGQGTINEAVAALHEGAYDFIVKPCDATRLKVTLERALEQQRTRREMVALRRRVKEGSGEFIGQSRAMKEVFGLIEKVAPSKASVVITGQSGTGKEMVARAVHQLSPRSERPFVAINCSAIPPTLMESEIFGHERGAFTGADQRRLGCFELADGGTLFLDEVGEIPPELQAKFLRVLEQEKVRRLGGKSEVSVDVRVIAATNRDLKEMIRTGQFREDLYFRLNVFQIKLPPLSDRPEDIPVLVDHFVKRFASDAQKRIRGVSRQAMRALGDYRWPGNIRELRNCVERAVLLCDGDQITEAHLPSELLAQEGEASIRVPLGMKLRDVDRAYIEAMLVRLGGNKARTALALGISEKTLYNKLHRYAKDDDQADARGRVTG